MPCAKCIPNPAKAKTVTVAKGQKGDAGAVFDLAPDPGSVSDQRAASGWVTAGVKKAKTNNLTNILYNSNPARSLRKIGSDAPHHFARESQLSAVSVNVGASSVRLKIGAGSRNGARLIIVVERFAEIFNRSDEAG